MSYTPTLDPDIVIVATGDRDGTPWVQYARVSNEETWTIAGKCNQCGLCVVGAANTEDYEWFGPPGTPMAVNDLRVAQGRLDEPVTPAFPDAMRRMAHALGVANVCSLSVHG